MRHSLIVLVIYCYATNYLKSKVLKQHTFFISQVLWHRSHLAGSSTPGLTGLWSRNLWRLRSHLEAPLGKHMLPSLLRLLAGSIHWGLLDYRLHFLSGDCPEFSLSSCHVGLSYMPACFKREPASKSKFTILCGLITEVTSPQRCRIRLIISKLLTGKQSHKAVRTEGRDQWPS